MNIRNISLSFVDLDFLIFHEELSVFFFHIKLNFVMALYLYLFILSLYQECIYISRRNIYMPRSFKPVFPLNNLHHAFIKMPDIFQIFTFNWQSKYTYSEKHSNHLDLFYIISITYIYVLNLCFISWFYFCHSLYYFYNQVLS